MSHATVASSSPRHSRSAPPPRIEGQRIAANAGAIALNGAMLLLLLMPLAAPQLLPERAPPPDVTWIERTPPRPVVPIPVPVVKAPVVAQPAATSTLPQSISPPAVVAAEPGDIALPSLPTTEPEPGAGTIGPPATQTGMQLQYAFAPPPKYPREALREGQRGTVLLQVLVGIHGQVLQVGIARSSGHRSLDNAARRHVLARWKFQPALRDGQPVQALGLVPVEFALR